MKEFIQKCKEIKRIDSQMKRGVIYFAILFCVFGSKTINAQNKIGLHLGSAFPVGKFSKYNPKEKYYGAAEQGFVIGSSLHTPISNRFEAIGLVDFCYNSLNKEARDDISGKNLPEHLNLAFSAGVQYDFNPDREAGGFVNFCITANSNTLTKFNYNGVSGKYSKILFKPGFKLGAGLLISKNIYFALNYMHLGNYEHTVHFDTGFSKKSDKSTICVDIITFTMGFTIINY